MAANRTQLQNALHKPYDRLLFSREVLSPVFGSGFSLFSSPSPAVVLPNKSESAVIDQVGIYGKILLDDSTEITCYEILLQPQVRIEQSKVAIQQYVRKLLTAGQAALINFVAPSNKNVWRLTLVACDSLITPDGVKEKKTNPKRFTYLLGSSETCRTAAERFETLSTEKEITFQSLVNAFSVEKLSKEFFDEYTLHYQNFCDYLQESNYRRSVFNISFPDNATKQEKDKASKPIRDFVKKLLGRIVFLYFVQKKGWLGASDTDYTDGPSDFIKQLFFKSGGNETFYSNWLTVLFFDTLNKERPNDDFTMPDGKTVKVPFLNGGLFDKEEFDEHLLTFPAKLFHHPDFEDTILTAKSNGFARGFLDFLDAFNFTVYEDSPDDHIVAVDPEMLGHIFENLLEDNKDKGAFYTPKEIVHYMCQESLTEYCLNLDFSDFGITMIDEDKRKLIESIIKKKEVDIELLKKSCQSGKPYESWFRQLEMHLDNVKICDPAIGSGAFPMGLLQEIFSIKELIAYETGKEWNPAEAKLNIIQNSIYGVDIEKGAVDIARLRFWLSLVIDEEKPKPLPNLDYKIVVGDSLISKFDGEMVEIDWERKQSVGKADEYVKNIQRLLVEVADKQKKYFNPNNKNKKKLQAEIRNLKIELLINQLSYNRLAYTEKNPLKGGFMPTAADIKHNTERELKIAGFNNLIGKLKNLLKNLDEPFNHFDWKLDFPEVLNPYLVPDEKQRGFDIVIGNPPYITYKGKEVVDISDEEVKQLIALYPNSAEYKVNSFALFTDKSINLLANNGILSFIIPSTILQNEYLKKIREYLITSYNISQIVTFSNKVFEAVTDSIILFVKNKFSETLETIVTRKNNLDFSFFEEVKNYIQAKWNDRTTGYVINLKTTNQEDEILDNIQYKCDFIDDYLEVYVGIVANGIKKFLTHSKLDEKHKKYLQGKHINNFEIQPDNLYINFLKEQLHSNTDETVYLQKEKILVRKTGNRLIAALDTEQYYTDQSIYNLYPKKGKKINLRIIVGLLNSKLLEYYFNKKMITNPDVFPYIKGIHLKKLPLKFPKRKVDEINFEAIVNYIIFLKSQSFIDLNDLFIPTFFEQMIDGMVYELYFPELLKKYDCEIIKHLGELPEFTENMSDEDKMEICQKVFDRLNDATHPVRINLDRMKEEIPEIRIIEGLDN